MLRLAVERRKNVLIAGGTSTGKTNALPSFTIEAGASAVTRRMDCRQHRFNYRFARSMTAINSEILRR